MDAREIFDPEADEGLIAGSSRRLREWLRDLGRPQEAFAWATIALLTVFLIYSYWPGLLNAQSSWSSAQYSHGWIVPVFSLALIFWWRKPVADEIAVWDRLAGLGLLIAAFALRLAVARYRIVTIDMYTFVPAVAGVFLMAGGRGMFRWAWAPIAFLIFMYPMPDEATRYLLGPLQSWATGVSTFALQTLGLDAVREGNQIIVGDMHLGVVDACSGLRMLTIFIALSVALVMLGNRPWWENLVVVFICATPIALIVNSIRITVTGLLYQVASSEVAEMVFHDLAGWVMMPMALGMLFLVQKILASLVVTEEAVLLPLSVSAAPATLVRPAQRPADTRDRPTPIAPLSSVAPLPRPTGGKPTGSKAPLPPVPLQKPPGAVRKQPDRP